MAQDIRASRPLQQCKKQVASYNFALRSSGFFPASQSLKKNKTSCQLHRRSSPMPAKIGWHGECHPYVARRLGLGSSSMKQGPMIPNQKLQCKSRCPCLLAQKNFLGGSWDIEVVLLCSLPSAAKTFLLCLQPAAAPQCSSCSSARRRWTPHCCDATLPRDVAPEVVQHGLTESNGLRRSTSPPLLDLCCTCATFWLTQTFLGGGPLPKLKAKAL